MTEPSQSTHTCAFDDHKPICICESVLCDRVLCKAVLLLSAALEPDGDQILQSQLLPSGRAVGVHVRLLQQSLCLRRFGRQPEGPHLLHGNVEG